MGVPGGRAFQAEGTSQAKAGGRNALGIQRCHERACVAGEGEGREVMGQIVLAWCALGRTWAFLLSEVGAMENS